MSNFFKNGNSEHKHGKICVTLRAALEDAYLAFVRHPRRVRSASRALSSAAAATVVLLDGEQIQFLSLNSVVHSESVHLKPIENVRTNNRKFGRNFSIGR